MTTTLLGADAGPAGRFTLSTIYEGKPQLWALVAYFCPPFGVMTDTKWMLLEDAVEYQRWGFWILVDPQSEADLVRWEQLERSKQGRKGPWFYRD